MTLPEFHSDITELAQAYETRRHSFVRQLQRVSQPRVQLALKRAMLSLDLCVSTLLTLEAEWPRFASYLRTLETELAERQQEVPTMSRLRKRLLSGMREASRRESLVALERSLDSALTLQARGELRTAQLHRTLATSAYTFHIEALAAMFDEDNAALILEEIDDALRVLVMLMLQTVPSTRLLGERLTVVEIVAVADRLLGWPTVARGHLVPAAAPTRPRRCNRSRSADWLTSAGRCRRRCWATCFGPRCSTPRSRRRCRGAPCGDGSVRSRACIRLIIDSTDPQWRAHRGAGGAPESLLDALGRPRFGYHAAAGLN
jgi:hypothetical protein